MFTRDHGQQRLIGKGLKRSTRKQAAVGIDLLEQGEVVFLPAIRAEAGLGTLTEWHQTQPFLGLRTTLPRWYAGQYAAEITSAMTQEGDPHPGLFESLLQLLQALCTAEQVAGPLVIFQRVLLEQAGVWPDLTRCVTCDLPAPEGRAAFYSAQQGGLVCRICQPKTQESRKISAAVLTALREQRCDAETLPVALDILDYTIAHVIGRPTSLRKSPLL
jgi:DNA repair protein RecO (recombination protein O)